MYFLQPYWEQVKSTGHLMVDLYVGCLVIGFHIFWFKLQLGSDLQCNYVHFIDLEWSFG